LSTSVRIIDNMEIKRHCVVCGRKGNPLGRSYSSAYLGKCKNCKMVFSMTIPSPAELKLHYANYDRNAEASNLTLKVYDSWFARWKILGYHSLLDFGCGLGALVNYANLNGFASEGVEIDSDVVSKLALKGVKVREFDNVLSTLEKYDVISIIEVLEHLSDPKMVLSQLKQKLSNSGMLFITTPNFNALNRRILRGNWRALWYPDHINIFTHTSIKTLLEECGYKVVSVESSGHIIFDRIPDTNVRRDNSSILSIEKQRNFFMKNSLTVKLKQILNYVLKATKLGDTLIICATICE
jgi:2-polyprenyl-3-methyl-5-hydroxy-6-metoxy-1,4-benzoquinol methylase